MREVRKRELMIRDAAKSGDERREKGRKEEKERGKGIKKQETRGDTSTPRTREKKEKENPNARLLQFFAIYPLLSGKPDPGRPFMEEIHWTFISQPHFCYCFPFTLRLSPVLSLKLLIRPVFFFLLFHKNDESFFTREIDCNHSYARYDRVRRFSWGALIYINPSCQKRNFSSVSFSASNTFPSEKRTSRESFVRTGEFSRFFINSNSFGTF